MLCILYWINLYQIELDEPIHPPNGTHHDCEKLLNEGFSLNEAYFEPVPQAK
jgi:hypothetical protein